jgi:beta-galactosidase
MLGVCYYPEHWPEARWAEDARRMKELGLTYVRVGEFAWSRLEPRPGQLDFGWLDRALDTLGGAGLRVVLGTPTATPPKWLVDRTPRMLAVDKEGRPRGFGSRRHYCFSSEAYARECRRIVTLLAERYGRHPAVAGWQTDNEYGCHDTVRCYCQGCRDAFRGWLKQRHGSLEALNHAWGNVFWSMEYQSWDEVELPNLTTTEANPAHWMDFYRFASDQVVAFNRLQVDLLRHHSPERFLAHNYMGFFNDFDHFRVAEDLDVASWDSYPLGFTDQSWFPAEVKRRYARTGHPDIAAFHHDLYRAVGRGRWWVMEQQPGPVNWAWHNPAPAPGMVRLWTWEALAHGAEVVSYFRWRQAPFAQEQMHAGLNRSDYEPDVGYFEVERAARELARVKLEPTARARVALVFDYEADWLLSIQPQGREFSYKAHVLEWYTAIRRLGFDVDLVPPGASLAGYALVLVPTLPIVREEARKAFAACEGQVVFGPRSGSKTEHFQLPEGLAPGALRSLLDVRVTRVESLAPELTEPLEWEGRRYTARAWMEHLEAPRGTEQARFGDGKPALVSQGRFHYLACAAEPSFLMDWFESVARQAGLEPLRLPEGVRLRRRGGLTFAFNSDAEPWRVPVRGARFVIGEDVVPPQGVCAWHG